MKLFNVICYMLYVICYMLYVICYMWSDISYLLSLISYLLYVICYMLYVINFICPGRKFFKVICYMLNIMYCICYVFLWMSYDCWWSCVHNDSIDKVVFYWWNDRSQMFNWMACFPKMFDIRRSIYRSNDRNLSHYVGMLYDRAPLSRNVTGAFVKPYAATSCYKKLSCHEMDPGGLMSSQTISPQHPGKSMDKAGNDLTEQHDIIII